MWKYHKHLEDKFETKMPEYEIFGLMRERCFLESALQVVEGQRHDWSAGRLFGQVTGRGSNVQVGVLQRNGGFQPVLEFFC